jgi:uncharacterized protein YcgI (DUF1989 family)
MDEVISLDLNAKLTLRLRSVRGAVVAARTGWCRRRARRPIPQDCRSVRQAGGRLLAFDAANTDEHRYRLYGVQEEHASCAGDFRKVMAPFLGSVRLIPQPANLFMSVGVFPDGRVETGDHPSKPGDCVVFRAWTDSIVALSVCPQEFNPVAGRYPTDLHVGIYGAA